MDSIFENIVFRGGDDDASSASLLCGRPIRVYLPKVFLIICILGGGELSYKIYQCLSFYSNPRTVFYIKLAKFNGPLNHPSYCFGFVHCFFYRLVSHNYDGISLEVGTQFPRSYYQGEGDLLYRRISCFCTLEILADIVHRELHPVFFPDQCCADCCNRYR